MLSPVARSVSSQGENALAHLLEENPNHFYDVFKELEDWEAVLKSLPDFDVKGLS